MKKKKIVIITNHDYHYKLANILIPKKYSFSEIRIPRSKIRNINSKNIILEPIEKFRHKAIFHYDFKKNFEKEIKFINNYDVIISIDYQDFLTCSLINFYKKKKYTLLKVTLIIILQMKKN